MVQLRSGLETAVASFRSIGSVVSANNASLEKLLQSYEATMGEFRERLEAIKQKTDSLK
jgi:hypothetical protein